MKKLPNKLKHAQGAEGAQESKGKDDNVVDAEFEEVKDDK